MPARELCLLVEGGRLRPCWLPVPARVCIEQPKTLEGLLLPERTWVWHGQYADVVHPTSRDPLRVKVFREQVQPIREEPEKPMFDELVVKGLVW